MLEVIAAHDKHFMQVAYAMAMQCSDDPDTKSGCLLVLANAAIIYGANRLPEGIEKLESRITKPLKYEYIEHCERDAIHRAKQSVQGSTLYVNWKPCMQCACAIINAGISRVVIHKEGQEAYERCASENKSTQAWHGEDSITFMQEAGVQVDVISMTWDNTVQGMYRGISVTF